MTAGLDNIDFVFLFSFVVTLKKNLNPAIYLKVGSEIRWMMWEKKTKKEFNVTVKEKQRKSGEEQIRLSERLGLGRWK